MTLRSLALASAVALGVGVAAGAVAHGVPQAADLGDLAALGADEPIEITLALGLPDPAAAESRLRSLTTPGDPLYGHFLSSSEFLAEFGPSPQRMQAAIEALARRGLRAQRDTATTLHVSAPAAAMARAFGVSLHRFAVPARGREPGYGFHAPLTRPTLPAELSGTIVGVAGLDDRPALRPHHVRVPEQLRPRSQARAGSATGNAPGSLTVADFADLYDVQPLYGTGIRGTGRTLGILTFASFTPSDAFAYWSAAGLTVDPQRVTVVDVDGGPGAPSDTAGSDETTLDVEQAGGVAPGATIVVYQAPNTNQGFVDLFARAVDDNQAESVSVSWGEWEWFDTAGNSPVLDPASGSTVSSTRAIHELLLRAAIQGQSVFTSAGDGGAYEVNHDLGCYGPASSVIPKSCSLALSVDYPATDPAITAAGGTTLAGSQQYCLDASCTAPLYTVTIPDERVWGWDYLSEFCAVAGYGDPVGCGIFGVGGGGGVSILFERPSYQQSLQGTQQSAVQQVFSAGTYYVQADGIPPQVPLPPFFPGRNIPDVSFNADPQTGYVVYYTSSVAGSTLAMDTFYGGTSFVAPQLNGVAALLGEYLQGKRVGLLNAALYRAAQGRHISAGGGALVNRIAYGDNWYYFGRSGYSPAAGVGTLDIAKFATYLLHGAP